MTVEIYFKKGKKPSHPWLYKNDVTNISVVETAEVGEILILRDHKNKCLGTGYLCPSEKIAGYLLSYIEGNFKELLLNNLEKAIVKRGGNHFCRLVFAEGDYIPGLLVDRHGDIITVEYRNVGICFYRKIIELRLLEICPNMIISFNNKLEVIGTVHDTIAVKENDLNFKCHVLTGQKTGYYYDQKENHLLFKNHASGRRVLDAFCYVGGFGVHAQAGLAQSVVFIDSSIAALELVKQNCIADNYKIIQDDAFDALQSLANNGEEFDLISIDPPPFTKSQRDKPKALTAHYKLITLMHKLLAKDGIGFYSTCSHHITSADIFGIISKIFQKDFELISKSGQPNDHPIRSDFKEGKYLNTIIIKKR